ncbi:EAL domain-containing protein [Sulfurimonas sp. SAG-AH-194-C21]|nr:GGDEF domain-containing phosphodiesterase [Sulfurimonas sp. SAG-AH-194-C21]MDF1884405.1 EAL domain-containing protein [Sulfurimonas sp. SAG-AH-194-C21]
MSLDSCTLISSIANNVDLIQKLKEQKKVNYFLINLDNFSNINSAYGYDIGDNVLYQVADYLCMVKPKSAILYRFNADKFVLIDERELNNNDIRSIAESILSFFSQIDIVVEKYLEFKVSLSIGVSCDIGLSNIIQAESAINEMREMRRHHYYIYDAKSDYVKEQEKKVYWILRIKEAVADENIVAYFQPIINNHTGKIEKYECLARIKNENKIIPPYMFMDAARITGNLSYVTKSLISQSFKKFAGTDYEFSLNITGEDLLLDYLELYLLKNVKKYNIDPSKVVLEMLEDITTLDKGTTLAQLNSLREKGFQIAIDDFGAENSNMSRLLELKPDYLKIDGTFIKNIVSDENSAIIVESIVFLCKKSNIKMIAEYVHNKEVQEKVKDLGIEYSQGYYFGEPKPDLIELSTSL